MTVRKSILPTDSLLSQTDVPYDYADSYIAPLFSKKRTPEDVGRAFFSSSPRWVDVLFSLRNRIVSLFGLKTSGNTTDRAAQIKAFRGKPGERMGLFQVFAKNENELILGEDDKHLDFRVSLFLAENGSEQTLCISTTVRFHNRFGRLYFMPVRPFHSLVVPAMLKGIVRQLEKQASQAIGNPK